MAKLSGCFSFSLRSLRLVLVGKYAVDYPCWSSSQAAFSRSAQFLSADALQTLDTLRKSVPPRTSSENTTQTDTKFSKTTDSIGIRYHAPTSYKSNACRPHPAPTNASDYHVNDNITLIQTKRKLRKIQRQMLHRKRMINAIETTLQDCPNAFHSVRVCHSIDKLLGRMADGLMFIRLVDHCFVERNVRAFKNGSDADRKIFSAGVAAIKIWEGFSRCDIFSFAVGTVGSSFP